MVRVTAIETVLNKDELTFTYKKKKVIDRIQKSELFLIGVPGEAGKYEGEAVFREFMAEYIQN